MNNISSLTESVQHFLEKDERCRNDDRLLLAFMWYKTIQKNNVDFSTLSAKGLLDLYIKNLLPNHDSITRARRKVQEINPKLRGSNYEKRQDNQEIVKKDLGYILVKN
jgi:hypothetical protein|tara:strand:- start:1038 stop:1361 length:324 start_codon:yes stop_codon:yes gene_type:complete